MNYVTYVTLSIIIIYNSAYIQYSDTLLILMLVFTVMHEWILFVYLCKLSGITILKYLFLHITVYYLFFVYYNQPKMPYNSQLSQSLSFLINDSNCHVRFVK